MLHSQLMLVPSFLIKQDQQICFQDLFKRVIPHQCLGAVWSRRDKSRDRDAATVAATIEQFNAVSYRVISTVLMPTEAKPQHRAKVITKWIDIAQVNSKMSKDFISSHIWLNGSNNNYYETTNQNFRAI